MTEMIERVEHAIAAAIEDGHGGDTQALARAAIEAMREPCRGMVNAYRNDSGGGRQVAPGYLDAFEVRGIYRAMIDAALSPETP